MPARPQHTRLVIGIGNPLRGADGVGGLQHHHLAPGQRQRACHRQADDAGPDHHAVQ